VARTRYRIATTPEADEDLSEIKRSNIGAYRAIDTYIYEVVEKRPLAAGTPLRDEWTGCRSGHAGRDRYRVIWEVLDPEDDYEGQEGDQVVPVVILRVGPKIDALGHSIYEQDRPSPG
jgi:mRNA-degrading endonuclease RelE of RelBE toxin-antitoxin system